jgi:hypothetical protein
MNSPEHMKVAVGAPVPREPAKQDMAVRTVVRGPIPVDDVVSVAKILQDDSLDEDGKIQAIAKVPDISTEGAIILVRTWYDAGRSEKQWEENALYGFIQQNLISKTQGRIAMDKTAFRKGDVVRIKPEFCDHPDEAEMDYVVVEGKGSRLDISPKEWKHGKIAPVETVEKRMLTGKTMDKTAMSMGIVVASELVKVAKEIFADKKDISRAELSRLLGGRRFKLRNVSFSDLARGGAVRLIVEGVPTGDIFTREQVDANKEMFALLRSIKEDYTINGQRILTGSVKTADSRTVADAVSSIKKLQGMMTNMQREILRVVGEIKRDPMPSTAEIENDLLLCVGELQDAWKALRDAAFQGGKAMADREMGWLR